MPENQTTKELRVVLIGLVGRVFTNGSGSIPGRIIQKTFKDGTWYLIA